MKHGTITHPKTIRLSALLAVPLLHAVGILHALWEWAADACPDGSIPFDSSEQLEQAVRYDGPRGGLLDSLIIAQLVDMMRARSAHGARTTYTIHDWPEHCEYNVHNKLARAHKHFANGQVPNLTRLTKDERNACQAFYDSHPKRAPNARRTLGTSTRACAVLAPPRPAPPVPDNPPTPNGENGVYSTDFLNFWECYPKKVGKGGAWKAWKRLGAGRPPVGMMREAVQAQQHSEDWMKEGGRYIPHPATWLNGRRWEDELQPLTPIASEPAGAPALRAAIANINAKAKQQEQPNEPF